MWTAAQKKGIKVLVFSAPANALFGTGCDPDVLLPMLVMPLLFLLAEFDGITRVDSRPPTLQGQIADSAKTVETINMGLQLLFQQATVADNEGDPVIMLPCEEKQGITMNATRSYLEVLVP